MKMFEFIANVTFTIRSSILELHVSSSFWYLNYWSPSSLYVHALNNIEATMLTSFVRSCDITEEEVGLLGMKCNLESLIGYTRKVKGFV